MAIIISYAFFGPAWKRNQYDVETEKVREEKLLVIYIWSIVLARRFVLEERSDLDAR